MSALYEFFWVFFSVFWWDFRVFSLWVGEGGKGREMREDFSLPVVMNQEIEFCI